MAGEGGRKSAMRSKSPSARAPSPLLRNGLTGKGERRKAIPLEGLARLSTDVFLENSPVGHPSASEPKPFHGVVICITGFSRGLHLRSHAFASLWFCKDGCLECDIQPCLLA